MSEPNWKQRERMGAKYFGATRNPGSGINSGHSHSDSLHEVLYIEQKSTKKSAIHTLHKDAKAKAKGEGKTPVILHHPVGYKGFYVIVHSSDMPVVVSEYLAARGYGICADDIPHDSHLSQEDYGETPDDLWADGGPSGTDPNTYYDEFPAQLLSDRAEACRFLLYTLRLLSDEENANVEQRIQDWVAHHKED